VEITVWSGGQGERRRIFTVVIVLGVEPIPEEKEREG
jgi:hypothetical protein